MTATTYFLYRLLMALHAPIRTKSKLTQALQEGRFLNRLYVLLGQENWKCAAEIPELHAEYRVLEILEQNKTSLQQRIEELEKMLKVREKSPLNSETGGLPGKTDPLETEIQYLQTAILEKSREMDQLDKESASYRECAHEIDALRRQLDHLQEKQATFEQRLSENRNGDAALIAEIARQKLLVALQSLRLNTRQLDELIEPQFLKVGLYLAEHPSIVKAEGKLHRQNKHLLSLIRAATRSHARLWLIAKH